MMRGVMMIPTNMEKCQAAGKNVELAPVTNMKQAAVMFSKMVSIEYVCTVYIHVKIVVTLQIIQLVFTCVVTTGIEAVKQRHIRIGINSSYVVSD